MLLMRKVLQCKHRGWERRREQKGERLWDGNGIVTQKCGMKGVLFLGKWEVRDMSKR